MRWKAIRLSLVLFQRIWYGHLLNYQFGGMEHPGAIQLSDRRIFLEKNATQEEELYRTELDRP